MSLTNHAHSPYQPCIEHQNGSCDCFLADSFEKGMPVYERPPRCGLYPSATYEEEDESEGTFLDAEGSCTM